MKMGLFNRGGKKALEKRFTTFAEQLAHIFDRIKTDMNQANSRVDSVEGDIKKLHAWINYLNRQNSDLSAQNTDLKQKYSQISRKSDSLYDNHNHLASQTEKVSRVIEDHQEILKTHKTQVSEVLDSHKEDLKKALQRQENLTKDEVARLKSWVSYYMTLVDKHKDKETALEAELASLRASFTETAQTSETVINSLRSDNLALKQHLVSVSDQLENLSSGLQSTKSELSETKDTLENTQKIIENLRNISESETSKPQQMQPAVQDQQFFQPQQALPQVQMPVFPPQAASTAFERHIMSRVMPNRKGYILRYIMELASEQRYSTKEVEEIVVKEKNLCGRTSFYAYLKELKMRGKLSYANIDERSIVVNVEKNTQQQLDNYQK